MKPFSFLFTLIFLLCPMSFAYCQKDLYQQRFENPVELETFINKAMKDLKIPGIAVGVVKGDKVLYAKGFGVRELGKPAKVDANTIFPIASLTKSFTATLAAKLVDQKKLTWGAKVIDHLPWFRLSESYPTDEATLTDFLCHRIGISPLGTGLMRMFGYSNRDIFTSWKFTPFTYSFRSNHLYDNSGYELLGELESAVSGASWEELIKRELLDPLMMEQTFTKQVDTSSSNLSLTHTIVSKQLCTFKKPFMIADKVSASGAMYSNVRDLCNFAIFQLQQGIYNGRQLVSKEQIQQIHAPHILMDPSKWFSSGLGWVAGLEALPGKKEKLPIAYNLGGFIGLFAKIILYPSEDLGVIILENRDCQEVVDHLPGILVDYCQTGKISQYSREIMEEASKALAALLDAPEAPKMENVVLPSMKLSCYVGTYTHRAFGNVEILKTQKGLQIKFPTLQVYDLEHQTRDTFVMQLTEDHDKADREYFRVMFEPLTQISFTPSTDGKECVLFNWHLFSDPSLGISPIFERIKKD